MRDDGDDVRQSSHRRRESEEEGENINMSKEILLISSPHMINWFAEAWLRIIVVLLNNDITSMVETRERIGKKFRYQKADYEDEKLKFCIDFVS